MGRRMSCLWYLVRLGVPRSLIRAELGQCGRLPPGKKGDPAGLQPGGLVEEGRERAGDGGGVAAVLGKVLAETRTSPAGAWPAAR
jgi:hypothetical protein